MLELFSRSEVYTAGNVVGRSQTVMQTCPSAAATSSGTGFAQHIAELPIWSLQECCAGESD
jgi:hypothetical protein